MNEEAAAALLRRRYGLETAAIRPAALGAGSYTCFLTDENGEEYVLKFPSPGGCNHPELETELCAFLRQKGLPVCEFLPNRDGELLTRDDAGRLFTLQRAFDGDCYAYHSAPDWLLGAQAAMLGRIHAALRDYPALPVGIGADFFRNMTPQRALLSYEKSRQRALAMGDEQSAAELTWRMGLMQRFPARTLDFSRLSCCNTHGDYMLSQLLCAGGAIRAVIDWTSACVHPAVWELFRSYVYASPRCREGQPDERELSDAVAAYRELAPLTDYDLERMPYVYFYQIAVCDYYGQYYSSTAPNRDIFLQQARFATRLMQCMEQNMI